MHWLIWERLSVHNFVGWKFQIDPSSLLSRLFKVRYFLKSDFIGLRLESNQSYVWRGKFRSKMVVKKGARWCIGTSLNIPLFGAPWLKDGLFFAPDNLIYASLAHVKMLIYDFALDSHKVVESFHTSVNDDNEFGCIINACRHLYQIDFKTRMSSLIGDKLMVTLMS
ncbi:hypothetical protein MTR_5g070140 [Medicago truncatula]|uniref:Uncharacterized protein n=1 Tax=Medicago truncatula TaxID=3880 RepID=G7K6D8_MEDTR|nr:hypothetical protein MTR_5g070140 [Medicago truncatula]